MAKIAKHWCVVGGEDKGGIIVREGSDLKSPQLAERLSHKAVVKEVEFIESSHRLKYELVQGSGPVSGWVSILMAGKQLCAKVVQPLREENLESQIGVIKGTAAADTDVPGTIEPKEWPFETIPGLVVSLQGFQVAPEFEGVSACLEKFDEAKGTWRVYLEGGHIQAVRRENLLLPKHIEEQVGAGTQEARSDSRQALGAAKDFLSHAQKDKRPGGFSADARARTLASELSDTLKYSISEAKASEHLLVLGELYFRAGMPGLAAKCFRNSVFSCSLSPNHDFIDETLRLANIGRAAAAQCCLDFKHTDGPGESEAAASMAAAVTVGQQRFHSLSEANVQPTQDIRPKGAASHAIILLHGYGGDGYDLMHVGKALSSQLGYASTTRLLFPSGMFGNSWRDMTHVDRRDPFRWRTVVATLSQINFLIESLEADGILPDKILIGGFSQGSFMATLVALTRRGQRLGGLLLLGGGVGSRVAAFVKTMTGPLGSPSDLPIFIGHGADDSTVPLSAAKEAVEDFRSLGIKEPLFKIYPGVGHAIPPEMITDAAAFAKVCFGQAKH